MPHTIVIVEDDRNINELVSEYMENAGYRTIAYWAGDAAFKDIREARREMDLFILDIMLPGVNGLDLLKEIRANKRHENKPVLMLTARGGESTQMQCFTHLADDYVSKPFSPRILVQRTRALIRRVETHAFVNPTESAVKPNTLSAGSIVIHTDAYEAFENGKKLTLRPLEFKLLCFFVQNQKQVLSRQQLLDAVWGCDYFGEERVVDAHIKNLRKKMNHDIIETIKGVGYKCVT